MAGRNLRSNDFVAIRQTGPSAPQENNSLYNVQMSQLGNTDFKAKIQLATLNDYEKFLKLLHSPRMNGTLQRIYIQQDYVMDGISHDLWNAGLTLAIRHTTDQYPINQIHMDPICTVSLKETLFTDLVDINGHLMSAGQSNSESEPPYYEIRETEEQIALSSIKDIISGSAITASTCNSKIIRNVVNNNDIKGGLRCVGSFVNLRHIYLVPGFPVLEVDKCKFPHEDGFFVRFPPEDVVIYKILALINANGIKYEINLKSKTALFFTGLPNPPPIENVPISQDTEKTPKIPMPVHINIDLTKFSPDLMKNAAPEISGFPFLPHDDNMLLVPPVHTNATSPHSPVSPSLSATDSSSVTGSYPPPAHYSSSSSHNRSVGKRGRKSLVTKLLEKSATSPGDLPETIETTINGLNINLSNVQEDQAVSIVKTYQKKKSSEASARYRKRKQDEMDRLKESVSKLEEEVSYWKKKCKKLEDQLNSRSNSEDGQ